MTISSALFRHDVVFLQEHFAPWALWIIEGVARHSEKLSAKTLSP